MQQILHEMLNKFKNLYLISFSIHTYRAVVAAYYIKDSIHSLAVQHLLNYS